MAIVRALLHGGPLDGRAVSMNVVDVQDPPMLYEVGFVSGGQRGPAEFRTYRRVARNPYDGRAWDYQATGRFRMVDLAPGPKRPKPPRRRLRNESARTGVSRAEAARTGRGGRGGADQTGG